MQHNSFNRRVAMGGILGMAAYASGDFTATRMWSAVPVGHDPSQDYRAWFFEGDTTTSLSADQFERLKGLLVQVVEHDVRDNDVVWLAEIAGASKIVKQFALPVARTQSQRSAGSSPDEVKKTIMATINGFSRRAKLTDLRGPIETSLDVLATQRRASDRLLVLASDFVTDLGSGKATTEPPPLADGVSASGTRVALLVARPTPDYLRSLRIASPSEHYHRVVDSWTRYFKSMGAASATARPIDALVG